MSETSQLERNSAALDGRLFVSEGHKHNLCALQQAQ